MKDWHWKSSKLELSLAAIEKAFNDEKLTNSCFNWKTEVFDLLRHLCSFTANWEAPHILFFIGNRHINHLERFAVNSDETNRWIRETCWTPSETESRLAIEKAFDNEKSTNSCFNWNESTIKINWKLITDTSIDWKMGWVVLRQWCSCTNVPKALHVLFESADTCISAMAFNAIVAKLFWFVEVTCFNANIAKAWRETVGVEDTWTFTTRDWTQHDNPPNEQIVEKSTWADEKLPWLAKHKCAVWGLVRCSSWSMSVVSEYTKPCLFRTSVLEEQRNPLESRLIGVGWELLEAAIG